MEVYRVVVRNKISASRAVPVMIVPELNLMLSVIVYDIDLD